MDYRFMNDVKVSLLGFGGMRFPTLEDGKIDRDKAFEMMDYAYENGVNYYDTAYFYHNGESELLMGEWFKTKDRTSLYVADKFPIWEVKTDEDVEKIFNEQLTKLQLDYIDFYLMHALDKEKWEKVKKYNVMDLVEQKKKEGIVKSIGFSFHGSYEDFKYILDDYDWEFCQLQLNYMDTEHQQGLKGYYDLVEKDIPVIIMEPIKGGKLVSFADDIKDLFTSYNSEASLASWALRWCADLDQVKVILSGMSTLDHVVDNVNSLSNVKKLNDEERDIINKVGIELNKRISIKCTSCDYCMPCPYGVNIPKNFTVYNDYSMYKNENYTKWAYSNLEKNEADASICVICGVCIEKCPQNIDIPSELTLIKEKL